jgi:hypothetical protein
VNAVLFSVFLCFPITCCFVLHHVCFFVISIFSPRRYLGDFIGMDLKGSDIAKMGDGKWLNDECINVYMKILQKRADDEKKHKLYFFNSFFYEKLSHEGYEKVQRWTRRVDVFKMDKVNRKTVFFVLFF